MLTLLKANSKLKANFLLNLKLRFIFCYLFKLFITTITTIITISITNIFNVNIYKNHLPFSIS